MTGKSNVSESVGFRRFVARRRNTTVTWPFQRRANTSEKIASGVKLQNDLRAQNAGARDNQEL